MNRLLESSIFSMMSCAFDKPLDYIAYLYGLSLSDLMIILGRMGYPDVVIRSQIRPVGYPENACKHCGILSTGQLYCSENCSTEYRKKQTVLQNAEMTGIIPTTNPKVSYKV